MKEGASEDARNACIHAVFCARKAAGENEGVLEDRRLEFIAAGFIMGAQARGAARVEQRLP